MLDPKRVYSRKENIIYDGSVPIIKLKQKFIDIESLSKEGTKYMNRYLAMFPNLFEKIEQQKEVTINQLSLF